MHLPDGVVSDYLDAAARQLRDAGGHGYGQRHCARGDAASLRAVLHDEEPGKGTGLGLATVYGIAKQNNGGIQRGERRSAAAAPSASISRRATSLPSMTVTGRQRSSHGKATILIVEDDPGIRELSAKILTRSGYDVLVADGGEEALQICERHDGVIHVLLSDVVMPGMNGRGGGDPHQDAARAESRIHVGLHR